MDPEEIIRISRALKTASNISLPSTTKDSEAKFTFYGALDQRLSNSNPIEKIDVKNLFDFDHISFPANDREDRLREFETLFDEIVNHVIENDNGNDTPVLSLTSFTVTPRIVESLAKLVESHPKYLVSEENMDRIASKIQELENGGDTANILRYQDPFERLQRANELAKAYVPTATEVKNRTNLFYRLFIAICYKPISAVLRAIFPNRTATRQRQTDVPLAIEVIDPQRMTTPTNQTSNRRPVARGGNNRRGSLSNPTTHTQVNQRRNW